MVARIPGSSSLEVALSLLLWPLLLPLFSGVPGSDLFTLCETHSSGATRREKSLLTAPVRIDVPISVVGDLLPTTPAWLDRPDLTVGSGVVDIGYPLT